MVRKNAARTVSLAQLKKHKRAKAPKVKLISRRRLSVLASEQVVLRRKLPLTPLLELSARHPYDPLGRMDFYKPGRWDTTDNLVYMNVIVTGPTPGEWDGTACYGYFKAPADGTYLVVCNFSGYRITMRLGGPWGQSTDYTATTSDAGTVIADWSGTAGQTLGFGLSCTGPIIGYLASIQIFAL